MKLTKKISASQAPANNFEPLPAGWYPAQLEAIDQRTSQSGNDYLSLRFAVMEGAPYAGRKVFERLSLWSYNATAREIAEGRLAQIAAACGLDEIEDTDAILGREMDLRVKVAPKSDGSGSENRIVAIRALEREIAPEPAPASARARVEQRFGGTAAKKPAAPANAPKIPF